MADRNKREAKTVRRWADAILSLGASEDLAQLSKSLAQSAKTNIALGFRREVDPYGKEWAPRADGTTDRQILTQTGRLKRSWSSSANSRGFKIKSAVTYAKFHQRGTKRMTARRMVPDGDIPREWRDDFDDVVKRWQKRIKRRIKRKFR